MIYFIENTTTGAVKIGHTERTGQDRLREMRHANDGRLRLVTGHPGDRDAEKQLHERFEEDNIRGEWFEVTSELASYIQHISDEPADLVSSMRTDSTSRELPLTGWCFTIFDDDGFVRHRGRIIEIRDGKVRIREFKDGYTKQHQLSVDDLLDYQPQFHRSLDALRDLECDMRRLHRRCECVRCSPEYWANDLSEAYQQDGWVGFELARRIDEHP